MNLDFFIAEVLNPSWSLSPESDVPQEKPNRRIDWIQVSQSEISHPELVPAPLQVCRPKPCRSSSPSVLQQPQHQKLGPDLLPASLRIGRKSVDSQKPCQISLAKDDLAQDQELRKKTNYQTMVESLEAEGTRYYYQHPENRADRDPVSAPPNSHQNRRFARAMRGQSLVMARNMIQNIDPELVLREIRADLRAFQVLEEERALEVENDRKKGTIREFQITDDSRKTSRVNRHESIDPMTTVDGASTDHHDTSDDALEQSYQSISENTRDNVPLRTSQRSNSRKREGILLPMSGSRVHEHRKLKTR